MINLGYYPNTRRNINPVTKDSLETKQFLKMIREIRDKVEVALKRTNEIMKKKQDTKKKPEVECPNGDLVQMDVMHYNINQPSKKLLTKQLGPFPII